MIHPNMATMLCVVSTDAAFPQAVLRKELRRSVANSFNRITIDGDMSTNDTVILLANGLSGTTLALADFSEALDEVTRALARMIVSDGEGVSRFVEVEVLGAANDKEARTAAEAIANSTLVKCAWAGGDPNWGRILDAVGYCGKRAPVGRVVGVCLTRCRRPRPSARIPCFFQCNDMVDVDVGRVAKPCAVVW